VAAKKLVNDVEMEVERAWTYILKVGIRGRLLLLLLMHLVSRTCWLVLLGRSATLRLGFLLESVAVHQGKDTN
jgi:hypothetical protein